MRSLILILFFVIYNIAFASNPYVISPEEAKEFIGKKGYIFINTDNPEKYKKEHIPTAINISAFYLQNVAIQNNEKQKCNYLPLCPETVKKIFSQKGISNNSKIIINYSDLPHTATYVWFVLYAMGVPETNLKIIDGGLNLWKKKGYKTEKGEVVPKLSMFNPKPRYDVVATLKEVLEYAKAYLNGTPPQDKILIDVRSFQEFAGRQKIIEIKRSGHIPGARYIYWKAFLGKKGHLFRDITKIKKRIQKVKIDLNKEIILYCTIGNRSSFAFLAFKLAGAKKVKIYTGGWYEWGNREDLPIVEGRK